MITGWQPLGTALQCVRSREEISISAAGHVIGPSHTPNRRTSLGNRHALSRARRMEFVEGRLEFLPMPTNLHQLIVGYLYRLFFAHISRAKLGLVLLPEYRVKTLDGRFREPDLVVVLAEHEDQAGEQSRKRLISSSKSSTPTIRRATCKRSVPNTRGQAFPNAGSSTRATKRSPC